MAMGRPKIDIRMDDLEKLCALQATEEEIAQFFNCSVDTICRRCQEVFGMTFAEYYAQKKGQGRISLRRAQWQTAQKGNVTMQIWLGKQYLGQKDMNRTELTGADGKAIQTENLAALPDDQLNARLAEALAKMQEEKE